MNSGEGDEVSMMVVIEKYDFEYDASLETLINGFKESQSGSLVESKLSP